VVYIPRAHYDTIIQHPATMMQTAPWKSFPNNSAWPVVLCSVVDVRYRFPNEHLYKEGHNSIVAIVKLKVAGIPKMRTDNKFPWPMAGFIRQQSRNASNEFEVSLFQAGNVDYLIPEGLYLWRQVSLEAAIRLNHGHPEQVPVHAFYDSEEGNVEDAPLRPHKGVILMIDGMVPSGSEYDFGSGQGQENEMHFQQSGYNTIHVGWPNNTTEDRLCPWDLSTVSLPVGDMPEPPLISESVQITLIEKVNDCLRENELFKNFFLHPVNTSMYSDYEMVVEVPIDLETVQSRLKHKYYSTIDSFFADIKLIESNCRKYNDSNADVVKYAGELTAFFSAAIGELRLSVEKGGPLHGKQLRAQDLLQERVAILQFPQQSETSSVSARRSTRQDSLASIERRRAPRRAGSDIPESAALQEEPGQNLASSSQYFRRARAAANAAPAINMLGHGNRASNPGSRPRRGRTTSGDLHLQTRTRDAAVASESLGVARTRSARNTGRRAGSSDDEGNQDIHEVENQPNLRRSARERRSAIPNDMRVLDSDDPTFSGEEERERRPRRRQTNARGTRLQNGSCTDNAVSQAASSRGLRHRKEVNYGDIENSDIDTSRNTNRRRSRKKRDASSFDETDAISDTANRPSRSERLALRDRRLGRESPQESPVHESNSNGSNDDGHERLDGRRSTRTAGRTKYHETKSSVGTSDSEDKSASSSVEDSENDAEGVPNRKPAASVLSKRKLAQTASGIDLSVNERESSSVDEKVSSSHSESDFSASNSQLLPKKRSRPVRKRAPATSSGTRIRLSANTVRQSPRRQSRNDWKSSESEGCGKSSSSEELPPPRKIQRRAHSASNPPERPLRSRRAKAKLPSEDEFHSEGSSQQSSEGQEDYRKSNNRAKGTLFISKWPR
jgi:hypothetical protein